VQTAEQAKTDLTNWKPYINPIRLQVLGGEPLLHKEIKDIIRIAREIYPDTDLRMYTNGLLLKRHKDIKETLKKYNCMMVISVHSVDERYKKILLENLYEFLDGDVKIEKTSKSVVSFGKVFRKQGIKPYNSDYKKAHEVCRWTHCTQLYQGKLWKCTQTAFFDDLMRRINNHKDWEQYKDKYTSLKHDDSQEIKDKWFSEFLSPEPICAMCREDINDMIVNKNVW
jgi:hypothetical protein